MKLCINCLHYRNIGTYGQCRAQRNLRESPVDGKLMPRLDAIYLRDTSEYCGQDAAWFDQRVTPDVEARKAGV